MIHVMTVTNPESRMRSILRDIREELVRIATVLEHYATAGDAERAAVWSDLKPLVDAEAKTISKRLVRIAELVERDDDLANQCSDAVTRIENLWADVERAWKKAAIDSLPVATLRQSIDRCILEIGYLTVPDRANRVLRSLRVGAAMNFHEEFADEIPNLEARVALLRWLNAHPRLVGGVVDVPSGTIIRASGKPRRRLFSWVMVLGVMAVALASAGLAPSLLKLVGLGSVPPGSGGDYLWAVLFAYAGAVTHVAIAALKQLRQSGTSDDQRFTAIGNFTIWVHINEMYLVMYSLAIPIVAYVVILSTGRIDNLTMAFVGFSIDSVLDVVLARFDKAAPGRTEAIAASVR